MTKLCQKLKISHSDVIRALRYNNDDHGGFLGVGAGGAHPPPLPAWDDLRFSKKKKTMWFIGVEVEQETMSAPPPKKNPGSAPDDNQWI